MKLNKLKEFNEKKLLTNNINNINISILQKKKFDEINANELKYKLQLQYKSELNRQLESRKLRTLQTLAGKLSMNK